MSRRLVTAALVSTAILVVGLAATPAEACKGKTVLLKDDFNKVNRAWTRQWKHTEFDIGGGKLLIKAHNDFVDQVVFGGRFFPEADVCVDVILPKADFAAAGIAFTIAEQGQYYFAFVNLDGKVGVSLSTPDGWLQPLPAGDFEGVKLGPGAMNTLRLTWKGPPPKGSQAPEESTVSFYVNDKLVDTFDTPPNSGRKVGLLSDAKGGSIIEFRNFLATR
jgi:hypothetical protein